MAVNLPHLEEQPIETEFLLKLIDSVPDMVYAKTKDGQIIFVNDAFCDFFNTPRSEILNTRNLAFLSAKERSQFEAAAHTALREGYCETTIVVNGGQEERFLFCRKVPFTNKNGDVLLLSVAQDITEQRASEQEAVAASLELSQRNRELEHSNESLEEFAYAAAHDLKEPVRGMYNYADFLLSDYHDALPIGAIEYIRKIKSKAEQMNNMVKSLLHFSEINQSKIKRTECDIDGIVDHVVDSLENLIKESNAKIVRKNKLPKEMCIAPRIPEVFSNLISNAIKYNDSQQPTIEIGSFQDEGHTVFFVRDNGIGIDEKHQKTIFKMFQRLHQKDKYGGGTGVGLSIIKKIIERHNGDIWLESSGDEGTTFYFTLDET